MKLNQLKGTAKQSCPVCKGEGWVCENHPNEPWNEGDPECCGGAGAPCECNSLNTNYWKTQKKKKGPVN